MINNKIIIFSAPSASGKTTIVKHLLYLYPKLLGFSISCTTRPRKFNEVQGKDYFFLSKEAFLEKVAQGEFAEWEEVYPGIFYGTLKEEIHRLWEKGFCVLFDIDVKGGLNLKKKYSKNSLSVFVKPPSLNALQERISLRKRESFDECQIRLEKAQREIKYEPYFDKVLLNDNLQLALNQAKEMVAKFISN